MWPHDIITVVFSVYSRQNETHAVRTDAFSLALPPAMYDLTSPARDRTCSPCRRSVAPQPSDCQGNPEWVCFKLVPKADFNRK